MTMSSYALVYPIGWGKGGYAKLDIDDMDYYPVVLT